MHKLQIGGNLPGLIFTLACMGIFLAGVPAFWSFLALSAAAGSVIAVVLCILHRKATVNRYL